MINVIILTNFYSGLSDIFILSTIRVAYIMIRVDRGLRPPTILADYENEASRKR